MSIKLKSNFTQNEFDDAVKDLQEIVATNGGEIKVYIEEPLGKAVTIVDGYWDFDDEGKSSPCFWYNKQELDKRNIKYGNND